MSWGTAFTGAGRHTGGVAVPHHSYARRTASVFGEMLTFRKLLAAAPSGLERRALLANKVEDMINTVIRQIAFYDFESRLHKRRAEGELTSDDINSIWMEVQGSSLGPGGQVHGRLRDVLVLCPAFHSCALLRLFVWHSGTVSCMPSMLSTSADRTDSNGDISTC